MGEAKSWIFGGLAALALAGCSSPWKSQGSYKVGATYMIKGVKYHPAKNPSYEEEGYASWYGPGFHGKLTANGEIFDQNLMTAAHKTLPMPTIVEVENLENGRVMRLRVNDRGPFFKGENRILDVSKGAARELGFLRAGKAKVRVRYISVARVGGRPPSRDEALGAYYVRAGRYVSRAAALEARGGLSSYGRVALKSDGSRYAALLGPFRSEGEALETRDKVVAGGYVRASVLSARSAGI